MSDHTCLHTCLLKLPLYLPATTLHSLLPFIHQAPRPASSSHTLTCCNCVFVLNYLHQKLRQTNVTRSWLPPSSWDRQTWHDSARSKRTHQLDPLRTSPKNIKVLNWTMTSGNQIGECVEPSAECHKPTNRIWIQDLKSVCCFKPNSQMRPTFWLDRHRMNFPDRMGRPVTTENRMQSNFQKHAMLQCHHKIEDMRALSSNETRRSPRPDKIRQNQDAKLSDGASTDKP